MFSWLAGVIRRRRQRHHMRWRELERLMNMADRQAQLMEELQAAVAQEASVTSSAIKLMAGISAQMNDAIASARSMGASEDAMAGLANITRQIQANAQALAAAVQQNTPAPSIAVGASNAATSPTIVSTPSNPIPSDTAAEALLMSQKSEPTTTTSPAPVQSTNNPPTTSPAPVVVTGTATETPKDDSPVFPGTIVVQNPNETMNANPQTQGLGLSSPDNEPMNPSPTPAETTDPETAALAVQTAQATGVTGDTTPSRSAEEVNSTVSPATPDNIYSENFGGKPASDEQNDANELDRDKSLLG